MPGIDWNFRVNRTPISELPDGISAKKNKNSLLAINWAYIAIETDKDDAKRAKGVKKENKIQWGTKQQQQQQ